jgi:hypothetical protein
MADRRNRRNRGRKAKAPKAQAPTHRGLVARDLLDGSVAGPIHQRFVEWCKDREAVQGTGCVVKGETLNDNADPSQVSIRKARKFLAACRRAASGVHPTADVADLANWHRVALTVSVPLSQEPQPVAS